MCQRQAGIRQHEAGVGFCTVPSRLVHLSARTVGAADGVSSVEVSGTQTSPVPGHLTVALGLQRGPKHVFICASAHPAPRFNVSSPCQKSLC